MKYTRMLTERNVVEIVDDLSNLFLDKKVKEIRLFIKSDGGDLIDYLAVYDLLRLCSQAGKKVTTIGVGDVASSAIVAFLGGDKRLATENTLFLVHPTKFNLAGAMTIPFAQMKEDIDNIAKQTELHLKIMEERTKLEEVVPEWRILSETTEWQFDVNEAYQMGFVTHLGVKV